jgi:hypothetical protein
VVKVFYDDFDSNGVKEAFILTSKLETNEQKDNIWSDGKVWFVNAKRTEMLQDGLYTQTTFNPEIMTLKNVKVLHVYKEYTTGRLSFLYGTAGDKPHTYFNYPIGEIKHDNGICHDTYDGEYDEDLKLFTGHTYKWYCLYCENVNDPSKIKIREYGAIKISLEQFLEFEGEKEVLIR